MKNETICTVCGGRRHSYLGAFYIKCIDCGLWSSNQKAGFGNVIAGMDEISARNHKIAVQYLLPFLVATKKRVLDVGCANGSFLSIASDHGINGLGIEPDQASSVIGINAGLPILQHSFQTFPSNDYPLFDAIVFNDVFEHFDDPRAAIVKASRMLTDEGVIFINIPVSTGPVFIISRILYRMGLRAPFDRLWGRGLPSPHIYFYNPEALKSLMEAEGFTCDKLGRMISIDMQGLNERVECTFSGIAANIIKFFGVIYVAVADIFSPDVMFFIFRRKL